MYIPIYTLYMTTTIYSYIYWYIVYETDTYCIKQYLHLLISKSRVLYTMFSAYKRRFAIHQCDTASSYEVRCAEGGNINLSYKSVNFTDKVL